MKHAARCLYYLDSPSHLSGFDVSTLISVKCTENVSIRVRASESKGDTTKKILRPLLSLIRYIEISSGDWGTRRYTGDELSLLRFVSGEEEMPIPVGVGIGIKLPYIQLLPGDTRLRLVLRDDIDMGVMLEELEIYSLTTSTVTYISLQRTREYLWPESMIVRAIRDIAVTRGFAWCTSSSRVVLDLYDGHTLLCGRQEWTRRRVLRGSETWYAYSCDLPFIPLSSGLRVALSLIPLPPPVERSDEQCTIELYTVHAPPDEGWVLVESSPSIAKPTLRTWLGSWWYGTTTDTEQDNSGQDELEWNNELEG